MSQSNTARAESSEESPKAAARPVATFKAGGVEVNVWRNPTESKPLEVLQAGEDMLRNSGADIRHGGAKAFYSPSGDYIQMPPKEYFTDEPHYYSTARALDGREEPAQSPESCTVRQPGVCEKRKLGQICQVFTLPPSLASPITPRIRHRTSTPDSGTEERQERGLQGRSGCFKGRDHPRTPSTVTPFGFHRVLALSRSVHSRLGRRHRSSTAPPAPR